MNVLNGIRRPKTSMEAKVAEGVGFEPTEVFTFAGFQDRRICMLMYAGAWKSMIYLS